MSLGGFYYTDEIMDKPKPSEAFVVRADSAQIEAQCRFGPKPVMVADEKPQGRKKKLQQPKLNDYDLKNHVTWNELENVEDLPVKLDCVEEEDVTEERQPILPEEEDLSSDVENDDDDDFVVLDNESEDDKVDKWCVVKFRAGGQDEQDLDGDLDVCDDNCDTLSRPSTACEAPQSSFASIAKLAGLDLNDTLVPTSTRLKSNFMPHQARPQRTESAHSIEDGEWEFSNRKRQGAMNMMCVTKNRRRR